VLDLALLAGPLALFVALWAVVRLRRRTTKRRRARTSVPRSSAARLVLGFALALAVVAAGIAIGEPGFVAIGAATAAIQLVFLVLLFVARRLDHTQQP
jgi:hypothetical protein